MAYFFDTSYYLNSKVAQLKSGNFTNADGTAYTAAQVQQAILDWAGVSDIAAAARAHYEEYGRAEGLNPNVYFNEYEYLHAKAAQLNSIRHDGKTDWTAEDVLAAITAAGMIPAEHYELHGCFETDADGNFINPSNAFDANAYMAAKLALVQKDDPNGGHTPASVAEAFRDNGFSPVSHYAAHGAGEAAAAKTPLVQTVPMSMRVANDPGREAITGEILPANYNEPGKVTDPSDVGGKVPSSVSPVPLTALVSPLNPGDPDYTAPPSNVKDTAANPLIAVTGTVNGVTGVYWLAVDRGNNRALVLDSQGAILGWVDLGAVSGNGAASSGAITLGDIANPSAVDRDDLPPSVTVNEDLNNNFVVPPPAPETGGITVEQDGLTPAGLLVTGTISSKGESGVNLGQNGGVTGWIGYAGGVIDLTARLAPGGLLDATAVTGSGVLTLDASACEVAGIVIHGATNAKNAIIAGKKTLGIIGGGLADTITVRSGGVVDGIFGGDGDDKITVQSGGEAFYIYGDEGDDIITVSGRVGDGFPGSGDINGGAGDDTITVQSGGEAFYIYGDAGNDTIIVSGTVTGNIYGGEGNDEITVQSGGEAFYIYGDAGNDTIIVSGTVTGNIYGGEGNDEITVQSGGEARSITGEAGNDIITVSGTVDGSIEGGNGNDKITVSGTVNYDINGDAGDDEITVSGTVNQSISGGAGDDEITVSGTVTVDIYGNDGNDIITVQSGGEAGSIYGNGGDDTITVRSGGEIGYINGGDGIDTITVQSGGEVGSIDGDNDNDIITVSGTVYGSILGGDDDEGKDTITVEDGGVVIGYISGGKGADTLVLKESGLLVYQSEDDSGKLGTLSDLLTSSGQATTGTFDVVDCSALTDSDDNVVFWIEGYSSPTDWSGGVNPTDTPDITDNTARLIRGTYFANDSNFIANGTGSDSLLVYDNDATVGITNLEAVVIVGLCSDISAGTDGYLTIK